MMNNDESLAWWEAMRDGEARSVWEFQYQGDPRAPHIVLRGGKHSDGFINTLQFLSIVDNLVQTARALAEKLKVRLAGAKVDWVIGSPMAGIPFATMVATFLVAKRVGFNEKVKGGDKDLTCRFNIPAGENFLMVEEMTTTGATPQRGIEAVLERNPRAIPLDVVGAFLIRCDDQPPELRGKRLVSLVSLSELGIHYNEWEPRECPLCLKGSRAIESCKRVWPDLLQTMNDAAHPIPV